MLLIACVLTAAAASRGAVQLFTCRQRKRRQQTRLLCTHACCCWTSPHQSPIACLLYGRLRPDCHIHNPMPVLTLPLFPHISVCLACPVLHLMLPQVKQVRLQTGNRCTHREVNAAHAATWLLLLCLWTASAHVTGVSVNVQALKTLPCAPLVHRMLLQKCWAAAASQPVGSRPAGRERCAGQQQDTRHGSSGTQTQGHHLEYRPCQPVIELWSTQDADPARHAALASTQRVLRWPHSP